MTEEHGGGGFGVAMLGEESDKTKLVQESGLGKARDSFEYIGVCRGSEGEKEGDQVL